MAITQDDLRRMRKKAGKTLQELGEELGHSHQYLSKLEHGKRNADLLLAVRWAKACGFDLAIVGGEHSESVQRAERLNPVDAEIAARFLRVLPQMDPAHRATMLHMLDLWEKDAYFDEVDEEEGGKREGKIA